MDLNPISLLMSGVQGITNYFGQREANSAAADMAIRQQDFQKNMSDTAHQREVADLEAAGLNPILSAKYGGSSTPPGASAPVSNVLGPAADAFVNTAMAIRRQDADLKSIEQEVENKVKAGRLLEAQRDDAVAGAELKRNSAKRVAVGTQLDQEQLKGAKVEGKIDSSKLGVGLRYLNRVLHPINSAGSAFQKWAP